MTVFAALTYGELAGMFPHAGGQYVYLKEAFNPLTGFLYGWTLFAVVQSGTIAAVAVAFAKFSGVLVPQLGDSHVLWQPDTNGILFWLPAGFKITAAQLLGILSILIITAINASGISYGKMVNRVFTSTKLIALFGLILLGIFFFANGEVWHQNLAHFWDFGSYKTDDSGHVTFTALTSVGLVAAIGVALVGSLFSSDAWNNVTFIAGEIDNPKKNIPRALLFGTIAVTTLYMLANVAYLKLLPFYGNPNATDVMGKGLQFAMHDRVGTAAATMIFGNAATIIMALLIMVSTFGCNNGIVLASVRVYQVYGEGRIVF